MGWTNIAGWLAVVTTQGFFAGKYSLETAGYLDINYFVAQFISAAAVVASSGSYQPSAWQIYLIFMAILTFSTIGNIWGNRILGKWNTLAREYKSVTLVSIQD